MLFLEQSATHRYAVRARGLGNARRGFDAFGAITGGDGCGDKLAARAADVDDMHIAGRFAEQGRDACEPVAGDRLAAGQADRIIETVWKLDQLPDIAQLIDLMAFKGAA